MNYRGRVMELDLGWSGAELRCMAAEMAAEADQEIARLETDLELARRDAERYRWLREHFKFANDSMQELWFCDGIRCHRRESLELDVSIDKARAGNGGEG